MSLLFSFGRRLATLLLLTCIYAHAAEPKWVRISSAHFSVVTDAKRIKGHEVIARFEQMRAVFAELLVRQKVRMSEPVEILAFDDPATYAQIAATINGKEIGAPGLFLRGEDRVFIVLNTSVPDSWRTVERPFAHFLLDYNYPPTQPWFDEGFAEYFSSLYFTAAKTELGSDPQLAWPGQSNPGQQTKSFTQILNSEPWMSITDLLKAKPPASNGREENHHSLFYAQSWIFMHYLINRDKLSEAGRYFGMTEIQHVPAAEALQKAFGVSPAQLEQEVKSYFQSLTALQKSLAEAKSASAPPNPESVMKSPLPMKLEDVADSVQELLRPEAQALVAEVALRVPEHRDAAIAQLEKLTDDPKTETAVAHRALAWAYVQKGETKKAFAELHDALTINGSDPLSHFEVALAAYHSGQQGKYIQGLANTMESLHFVLGEFPDFAQAYNILGWARLAGGGGNAAVDAMKYAVQLAPRDESYQLRLARALLAAKKFDEATSTLDRLQHSADPQIAQAAAKDLEDLPFLKKYGVTPQEQEERNKNTPVMAKNADQTDTSESEDSEEEAPKKPAEPVIDRRPVKFVKGTLLSVDCSQSPVAILSILTGRETLKLRVRDINSATLIGTGKFSCDWKSKAVNVNYRAGAKGDGDLVSLEMQ